MEKYKRKFSEDKNAILDQIAATIDLIPLENEVKKRLGVPVKLFIEIKGTGLRRFLSVSSNDLTKYTGILKNVYSVFKLETFNSSIDDKEPTWWMTLNFRFSYKSGGSNGTDFLESWYNYENMKWTFR